MSAEPPHQSVSSKGARTDSGPGFWLFILREERRMEAAAGRGKGMRRAAERSSERKRTCPATAPGCGREGCRALLKAYLTSSACPWSR
jgi:hypothetical protein